MLGSPRWVGISLKQIARAPRAALRVTSATASSTSHSGMRHSGIRCAVGVPAPVLDHPVVVRTDALQPELEILAFHERLTAEPRERRERERAVDPAEREVLDARLRLVAAGSHLVVGQRRDEHLRAIEAGDVAVGRGVERDRDVPLVHVDQPVLVEPVVAPPTVVGHLLLVATRRRRARSRPTAPARRAVPARACAPGAAPARGAAGSTTWSSTLMIFGSSVIVRPFSRRRRADRAARRNRIHRACA